MYVLAADSDPVMCKAIKFMLAGEGHEVSTSCTGAGVVALAQEREPDLFILDMSLPDVDCLKVYQHLRRAGSSARVLFLVPKNDIILQPKEDLALASGDFLVKPFEPDHFIAKVRKLSAVAVGLTGPERAKRISVGGLQLRPDLSRLIIHQQKVVRVVSLSPVETEVAYLLMRSAGSGPSPAALVYQLGLPTDDRATVDAAEECLLALQAKVEEDPDQSRYMVRAPDGRFCVGMPTEPPAAVAEASILSRR
jgi:DNA-binding response OmpR family regulator